MKSHSNASSVGLLVAVLAAILLAVGAQAASAAYHPYVTSFGSFTAPESVATDSAGNIYVLDRGASNIQKFDSTGEPLEFTALGSNTLTGEATPDAFFNWNFFGGNQIAIDTSAGPNAGNLYVTDIGNEVIDVFSSATGEYLGQLSEGDGGPFTNPCGVAVGSEGDLYVALQNLQRIFRYEPAANPPTNADYADSVETGGGECGLGVDSDGDAYAVNRYNGTLTKFPASSFGGSGAPTTFGPTGALGVALDRGNDDVYVSHSNQAIAQYSTGGGPLGEFGVGKLSNPKGIAVDSTGRILVANTDAGNVAIFAPTPPPVPPVVASQSSAPAYEEAMLVAQVNPGNEAASFYFEYGPTASYGQSTPISAIAADGKPVTVTRNVAALKPGSTYHFRIVVTNSVDTVEGPDRTFTTLTRTGSGSCANETIRELQQSTWLAECRAFEQVSPIDKAELELQTSNLGPTQVSPDGEAATFSATGALPGAEASLVQSFYLARRSSAGWPSKGIDVPQSPTPVDGQLISKIAISADLSHSVYVSARGLTPDAVEGQFNTYLRDNETGAVSLIYTSTERPLFLLFPSGGGYLSGNTDFSHVTFQTPATLTPDAPDNGKRKLFEYTAGELRLVSILPNGSPSTDYANTAPLSMSRSISPDGSRIFFSLGEGTFDTLLGLYMRVDGETTVPISASQRTGEVGQIKPGIFRGASPDGSVVYFTSTAPLTDDSFPDQPRNGEALYRYENGELTDLTVYDPPREPVVGSGYGLVEASLSGEGIFWSEGGTIYSWREGERSVVATGLIGPVGAGERDVAKLSPDGSKLAFRDRAPLTGYDNVNPAKCHTDQLGGHDECEQAFVFDTEDQSLECASCRTDGQLSQGPVTFGAALSEGAVTDDGRVYFNTPDRLSPQDSNGQYDVYEYVGEARNLMSGGAANSRSLFMGSDTSGHNVFFTTTQQLVGQDRDRLLDLYAARVGGGFASQSPQGSRSPCSGEGCQGAPPPPPPSNRPGSATLPSGAGGRGCSKAQANANRATRKARGMKPGAARQKARAKAKRMQKKADNCRAGVS